jgi:hypothetical protein
MALNISTTQQAQQYLELLTKLKSIDASQVEMFVDLRNREVHFARVREFITPLADAIVTLEKSLYIWIQGIHPVYETVNALALSFSDAELVGF